MGEVTTVGLDIAKSVCQVHGIDAAGAVVIRRKVRRGQVPWSCKNAVAEAARAGHINRCGVVAILANLAVFAGSERPWPMALAC